MIKTSLLLLIIIITISCTQSSIKFLRLGEQKISQSAQYEPFKVNYANKSVSNLQFLEIMQNIVEESEKNNIQHLVLDFSKTSKFSGTFLSDINSGLHILGQITSIKELDMNFSGNKIEQTNFKGLITLNLIKNFTIRLDNNGIQTEDIDLEDLNSFKYLDSLILNYTSNSIDSLQPFSIINKLTYLDTLHLYMGHNQLRAVSELENLKLEDLTNLKLNFEGNYIKNINFMTKIPNFSYLKTLSFNFASNRILAIDQLSYISELSRIEYLYLDFGDNQIQEQDLFELGEWSFLKYLYINLSKGNQILKVTSLKQLNKCENLQILELNLSSIDLTDLDFFQELNINRLTDITIDASDNSLSTIDFTSITQLKSVKNLKLNFSKNSIKKADFDFSSQSAFYYIYINLDQNNLTSLSTLSSIQNLHSIHEFIIYAQKNGITDIDFVSGIANSPSLTYLTLYLIENGVTDPLPAKNLSKCKNLYIVWIFLTLNGCDQNQCQDVRNYFYANGPALVNFIC